MKGFFFSNAGKGTLGVCLTALVLVWPLVASWIVAALTLAFAVHHLCEAFRSLDAERAAMQERIDLLESRVGGEVAAPNGDACRNLDVDAVMANLASPRSR